LQAPVEKRQACSVNGRKYPRPRPRQNFEIQNRALGRPFPFQIRFVRYAINFAFRATSFACSHAASSVSATATRLIPMWRRHRHWRPQAPYRVQRSANGPATNRCSVWRRQSQEYSSRASSSRPAGRIRRIGIPMRCALLWCYRGRSPSAVATNGMRASPEPIRPAHSTPSLQGLPTSHGRRMVSGHSNYRNRAVGKDVHSTAIVASCGLPAGLTWAGDRFWHENILLEGRTNFQEYSRICAEMSRAVLTLATVYESLGNSFTVADLNVASILVWGKMARLNLSGHPQVTRWLDGYLARSAYGRVRDLSSRK
jgi:hypothetical protein